MKAFYVTMLAVLLAACAQSGGNGRQQIYGEVKSGVETSHTRIGR